MKLSVLTWIVALFVPFGCPIPPESFGLPSAPNDTALAVSFHHGGSLTAVAEGALFGFNSEPVTPLSTVTD